jgi:hypothetical protein
VGFIPLLFILQFTAMAFGLVIVFKRKDRKKPLHALIHEKSFPGTCSEHNTIFAPGSAIATLDEGQRPILDVNLPCDIGCAGLKLYIGYSGLKLLIGCAGLNGKSVVGPGAKLKYEWGRFTSRIGR